LQGSGHANRYCARPLGAIPLIDWLLDWVAASAECLEAESDRLAREATERPSLSNARSQKKAQYEARFRERKLAKRLATMSPEAAAVLLDEHERRKQAWTKRRTRASS
jgi:hypothetical protein